MIQVEHLVKRFPDAQNGEVTAVADVSFQVASGEVLGLLGGNGAGKTTTMRVLGTLLRPTTGRAIVAGCDVVADPAGVRSRLGYLSASTGLYERMTAWEHVTYFGRLYGMHGPVLAARLETVFEELHMNAFRSRLVGKLSTGMRQKVSIARAVVHDPPVLIFDEPTLGLDVLVARSVIESVERLKAQGKCILYSTHILREVERLCDRVAIMHNGRLLAIGPRYEVCQRFGARDVEEALFAVVDSDEGRIAAVPPVA